MKNTFLPSINFHELKAGFVLLLFGLLLIPFDIFAQDPNADIWVNINHVNSGGDGSIELEILNGDPPFTFVWEDEFGSIISEEQTISGLDAGDYSVTVTAGTGTNGSCESNGIFTILDCGSSTSTNADFSTTIDGLIVNFMDMSTACGGIIFWEWSFQDSNGTEIGSSDEQNPIFVFPSSGIYEVILTVISSNGVEVFTDQELNISGSSSLSAQINGPSLADIGEEIQLNTIVSPTGNYTYSWDFDGGNSFNDSSPTPFVSWSVGGQKDITVTVTNGVETTTATTTIFVEATSTDVDFEWEQVGALQNLTVSFSPIVTGAVGSIEYLWEFGYGNQSTMFISPIQEFPATGVYMVKLTVTDNNGSKSITKLVAVSDGTLMVDFTSSPAAVDGHVVAPDGTTDFEVTFTGTISGGNPDRYQCKWYFGDGAIVLSANNPQLWHTPSNGNIDVVSHTFSANDGSCRTVSFHAHDQGSGGSIFYPDVVDEIKYNYVCLNDPELVANFGIEDDCSLETMYFIEQSYGGALDDIPPFETVWGTNTPCDGDIQMYSSYQWTAYYLDEDAYPISIDNFFLNPSSPCSRINPDNAFLNAAFANNESVEVLIRHTVTDQAQDIAYAESLEVFYPPVTFNVEQDISACPGSEVLLGNVPILEGGRPQYQYQWQKQLSNGNWVSATSPSDLSCDNCPNPVVIAPANGVTKTFRLQVRYTQFPVFGDVCREQSPPIHVTGSQLIIDSGGAPDGTQLACIGESMMALGGDATAEGGTGTYTYNWSPSVNLSNATVSNPIVLPEFEGQNTTYNLVVTDSRGCTATDEVTVIGHDGEVIANAGEDNTHVCFGNEYKLGGNPTASGNGIAGLFSYQWNSESVSFSSDESNPILSADNPIVQFPGTYFMGVTVVDEGSGCFDTDIVELTVQEQFAWTGFEEDLNGWYPACLGEPNTHPVFSSSPNEIYTNTGGAVAPITYSWNVSDDQFTGDPVDFLYNPPGILPSFTPDADNSVAILTARDARGCTETFQSQSFLLDLAPPSIEIVVIEESSEPCAGGKICFKAIIDRNFTSNNPLDGDQMPLAWQATDNDDEMGIATYVSIPDDPNFGLYENFVDICFDFDTPGNKVISVTAGNNCGETTETIEIPVIAGNGTGNLNICNNTTSPNSVASDVYFSGTINSGGSVCGTPTLVAGGSNVSYVAGQSITLSASWSNSFTADYESDFLAIISECGEEGVFAITPNNNGTSTVESQQAKDKISIEEDGLSVTPNPFKDKLQINYLVGANEQSLSVVSLNIYNATGNMQKRIFNDSQIASGNYAQSVDLLALPPGIYFVVLEVDGRVMTERIVKH